MEMPNYEEVTADESRRGEDYARVMLSSGYDGDVRDAISTMYACYLASHRLVRLSVQGEELPELDVTDGERALAWRIRNEADERNPDRKYLLIVLEEEVTAKLARERQLRAAYAEIKRLSQPPAGLPERPQRTSERFVSAYPVEQTEAYFAALEQEVARLRGLARDTEILRRRIHLLEEHNQFFERCESLHCNPQGTSTYPGADASEREWLAIPPGDPAKSARIRELELALSASRADALKDGLEMAAKLMCKWCAEGESVEAIDGGFIHHQSPLHVTCRVNDLRSHFARMEKAS